jgi:hypothetical protein
VGEEVGGGEGVEGRDDEARGGGWFLVGCVTLVMLALTGLNQ